MEKGRLRVVNLFGAPGVGKSAARGGLFWLMKAMGASVEDISEYAKYLILAGRSWQLAREQLYVLAKQHHKQLILDGVYEYAITDSPLLLTSFYASPDTPAIFHDMCREYADQFDNVNFFLTRDLNSDSSAFEDEGRMHDREASIRIEGEQKEFLSSLGETWTEVPIDHKTAWEIVLLLKKSRPGSMSDLWPSMPDGLVAVPGFGAS